MARTRFSPWRGEMFIEKTDESPAPFGEAEWFLKGTARVDSASPNGEGVVKNIRSINISLRWSEEPLVTGS